MAAGKTPDLRAGRPAARALQPLDLPRLVMRRAAVVALGFLLLLLLLGVVAARVDTRDEIAGALAFARLEQRLHALPADDAAALASLREAGALRHVTLRITDPDGRVLFGDASPAAGGPLRRLLSLTLASDATSAQQTVSWRIARPAGGAWTATVVASPQSEQQEALSNLLGLLVLLTASSAMMLAVMRWNVQRAFRPLHGMLAAIARIEQHDTAGVQALPTMPVRELEAIAGALRRLADSLAQAESARRALSRKILDLQEDERQRLARELHDEFGQHLTALRVDVAWLQRGVEADDETARVLAGMDRQVARLQAELRSTLGRLQPLAGGGGEPERAGRLAALLDALAASWSRPGAGGLRCEATVTCRGVPDPAALHRVRLPAAVLLALYRISQEAFTNAVRHAAGRRVVVGVDIDDSDPGRVSLRWSASDDGAGLAQPETALQRGSGLAGIRERVWSLDGEFAWSAHNPPPLAGLRLEAHLSWQAAPREAP